MGERLEKTLIGTGIFAVVTGIGVLLINRFIEGSNNPFYGIGGAALGLVGLYTAKVGSDKRRNREFNATYACAVNTVRRETDYPKN